MDLLYIGIILALLLATMALVAGLAALEKKK
jgi:hypothetical protein